MTVRTSDRARMSSVIWVRGEKDVRWVDRSQEPHEPIASSGSRDETHPERAVDGLCGSNGRDVRRRRLRGSLGTLAESGPCANAVAERFVALGLQAVTGSRWRYQTCWFLRKRVEKFAFPRLPVAVFIIDREFGTHCGQWIVVKDGIVHDPGLPRATPSARIRSATRACCGSPCQFGRRSCRVRVKRNACALSFVVSGGNRTVVIPDSGFRGYHTGSRRHHTYLRCRFPHDTRRAG